MFSVEKHVLPHVRKTDTCWFWMRGHNTHSRAYCQNKLVYRELYKYYRGEIPPKQVLDHVVCDNPACINPWHVEPKTQKENLLRANVQLNLKHYLGDKEFGKQNLSRHGYLGRKDAIRDENGRFGGWESS